MTLERWASELSSDKIWRMGEFKYGHQSPPVTHVSFAPEWESVVGHITTRGPPNWYPQTLELKLSFQSNLLVCDCIFGEIGVILMHLFWEIALSDTSDQVGPRFACYPLWSPPSKRLVAVGLHRSSQIEDCEVLRRWFVIGSCAHPWQSRHKAILVE